jgi:starvation-inducible DNA-binding protein
MDGNLMSRFTNPGLTDAQRAAILQKQLSAYNDLHLTRKHVHWNVVGPNFTGVHEMIDPQVLLVRDYADDVAERMRADLENPAAPSAMRGPRPKRLRLEAQ